jgi:hypothetical protein
MQAGEIRQAPPSKQVTSAKSSVRRTTAPTDTAAATANSLNVAGNTQLMDHLIQMRFRNAIKTRDFNNRRLVFDSEAD